MYRSFTQGREKELHGADYKQFLSSPSHYFKYFAFVFCVPENFLSVADLTFYNPKDLQDNVPVNKTENGLPDAV